MNTTLETYQQLYINRQLFIAHWVESWFTHNPYCSPTYAEVHKEVCNTIGDDPPEHLQGPGLISAIYALAVKQGALRHSWLVHAVLKGKGIADPIIAPEVVTGI